LRHVRARAVGVRRTATGAAVALSDGRELTCEAVVVGAGVPPPGVGWAPDGLLSSPFFVPDPWAAGAIDVVRRDRTGPAHVLLVGTGPPMVAVVLSLSDASTRPDRVVHSVSRGGRLPSEHRPEIRLAAIPDISDWGHSLDEVRRHASRHLASVARTAG